MTTRSVRDFSKPFAVMKVGIKDHEEEAELWNLDKGCKPTFCHIIVRVREELKRAKQEGLPFYPFGLTQKTYSVLESIDSNHEPIEILFIPVIDEKEDWRYGFPRPRRIKWDYDCSRCQTLRTRSGGFTIPRSIRLWRSYEHPEFPSFLIDKIHTYKERGQYVLDCRGAPCRNVSTRTPIENSISGSVTFGLFENSKEEVATCKLLTLDVVARALLVSPFIGYAI